MKRLIYLDFAAATPIDDRVMLVMEPYFKTDFYNPSANYLEAKRVANKLSEARATVASILGAKTSEIIFTAGGTEANNLAISGIMRQFPKNNLVVSNIEHDSVIAPASEFNLKVAMVKPNGIIDLQNLKSLIDEQTVLVSIMYANNEIGTVEPIREIAALIQSLRAQRKNGVPLYFHVDAAQAANYLDLHVSTLKVDLMTLNGGKIYGPKQSGALFVSRKVELRPLIYGGGQEQGLRSGTENVAASVGFAVALDIAQQSRHQESQRLSDLQQLFYNLISAKLPTAKLNGTASERLPNNIHLTLPGQDNERLLIELEEEGILAAAGSACSAFKEEPSHVLKAIGVSDKDARASLRLTMGRGTSSADIEKTIATLAKLVI